MSVARRYVLSMLCDEMNHSVWNSQALFTRVHEWYGAYVRYASSPKLEQSFRFDVAERLVHEAHRLIDARCRVVSEP